MSSRPPHERVRCIIVDDEPNARELLREYAAAHDDLEIIGSFGDPVLALEAVASSEPDLLFLDIEMPRLNGFELLASLDWARLPVVVFTTAYDEHAVRAFEVAAVDYLLKPFHEERFAQAVTRATAAVHAARAQALDDADDEGNARAAESDGESAPTAAQDQLRRLLHEMSAAEPAGSARIAVRVGHRIRLLPTDLIDFIESDGNYVRIHSGGESYQLRETLSRIEQRLDPRLFARVHRQHIVNVTRVNELEPLFRGEYVLVLRGGKRVTTGRTYRDRVRELFDLGDS